MHCLHAYRSQFDCLCLYLYLFGCVGCIDNAYNHILEVGNFTLFTIALYITASGICLPSFTFWQGYIIIWQPYKSHNVISIMQGLSHKSYILERNAIYTHFFMYFQPFTQGFSPWLHHKVMQDLISHNIVADQMDQYNVSY